MRVESATYALLPSLDERVTRDLQRLANLPCTLRHDPELLNEPEPMMRDEPPAGAHPPDGEIIPQRLRLEHIALERVIPRDLVRPFREVLLVLNLEAHTDKCLSRLADGPHLGDTVPDLDTVRELLM